MCPDDYSFLVELRHRIDVWLEALRLEEQADLLAPPEITASQQIKVRPAQRRPASKYHTRRPTRP